jgi:hypothetical protein
MVSKKLPAVVATSALLVAVLLAPSAAQAQRGGGGRGSGGGGNGAAMGRGAANGRPAVTQQAPGRQWSGNQWSHNHNHFVGRPFFKPFVRPFFPYAVAPSVVYAAPYYYAPPYYQDYPPPAYYNPPQTYYAPPAPTYYDPAPATYYSPPPPSGTVSVAPAPPDNVIQYSHGRYELRGPSRWEWVPNSSTDVSLTPAAATPSSKKGEPSSPGVTFRGLFRWTDENGVTHWTQGLDAVPEQYRPKARRGAGAEGTL